MTFVPMRRFLPLTETGLRTLRTEDEDDVRRRTSLKTALRLGQRSRRAERSFGEVEASTAGLISLRIVVWSGGSCRMYVRIQKQSL